MRAVALQVVTGASAWKTGLGILHGRGGPHNLFAGVLSPCASVGMWKATTLGINYNLMQWVAGLQGLTIARTGEPEQKLVDTLPFWQVSTVSARAWVSRGRVGVPWQ